MHLSLFVISHEKLEGVGVHMVFHGEEVSSNPSKCQKSPWALDTIIGIVCLLDYIFSPRYRWPISFTVLLQFCWTPSRKTEVILYQYNIVFQTQTFWHKYTKGKKNQSWYGRHQPPTKSKTKKQNEQNKKQTHREKNQNKLYLDQVGDYIQKNIESRILIMFPSKKVNEAHDPVLAMANHASDVSWGNEMALSIEEK